MDLFSIFYWIIFFAFIIGTIIFEISMPIRGFFNRDYRFYLANYNKNIESNKFAVKILKFFAFKRAEKYLTTYQNRNIVTLSNNNIIMTYNRKESEITVTDLKNGNKTYNISWRYNTF